MEGSSGELGFVAWGLAAFAVTLAPVMALAMASDARKARRTEDARRRGLLALRGSLGAVLASLILVQIAVVTVEDEMGFGYLFYFLLIPAGLLHGTVGLLAWLFLRKGDSRPGAGGTRTKGQARRA